MAEDVRRKPLREGIKVKSAGRRLFVFSSRSLRLCATRPMPPGGGGAAKISGIPRRNRPAQHPHSVAVFPQLQQHGVALTKATVCGKSGFALANPAGGEKNVKCAGITASGSLHLINTLTSEMNKYSDTNENAGRGCGGGLPQLFAAPPPPGGIGFGGKQPSPS